jgi:hypothetical protein
MELRGCTAVVQAILRADVGEVGAYPAGCECIGTNTPTFGRWVALCHLAPFHAVGIDAVGE